MTTLLTITTAFLAVCASALGWRCRRLRKTLKNERKWREDAIDAAIKCESSCCPRLNSAIASNKFYKEQYDKILRAGFDEDCRYVISRNPDGSKYVVSKSNGGDGINITIKSFTGPDAGYNRLRAERLLDKLNEK